MSHKWSGGDPDFRPLRHPEKTFTPLEIARMTRFRAARERDHAMANATKHRPPENGGYRLMWTALVCLLLLAAYVVVVVRIGGG
jgi:hypothetical protein